MEELLALLGMGGGGFLLNEAYDKLGDIGDTALTGSEQIGQEASDYTNFTGYGVTGGLGSGTVSPDGSTAFQLGGRGVDYHNLMQNAAEDILRNRNITGYGNEALRTASGLLGGIGGDPALREQEIYDRIRAMQLPEESRAQEALESRLASQGRAGLRTAAYGGSPEQLAMSKAVQEAQNAASYEAIRLAMEQQGQDANIAGLLSQTGVGTLGARADIASTLGAGSYLPYQMLLDQFNAGTQAYSFEDIARRQGANILAQAGMGGLEGLLGAGLGQANLVGQVGTSLLGGGMGLLGSAIQGGSTPILDWIGGWF